MQQIKKIPKKRLQHALYFCARALQIIAEESTIFTAKYFCPVSAALLTPGNTNTMKGVLQHLRRGRESSKPHSLHQPLRHAQPGKLHGAKALHAAHKGRSLTGKFLQDEAERVRTGYFTVPPPFKV